MGKGLAARSVNLRINPFTLVGATTRFSMVSAPLRDRFGSVWRLEYYDVDEMNIIVERSARILDAQCDAEGVSEIARRSRGTPRVANRLLRRTRDYALVKADNRISGPVARAALEQLNVDPLGLDQSDHRLLSSIIDKFDGGPVGLETLAAALNEDFRHHHGRMGAVPAATGLPRPARPGAGWQPVWPTNTWAALITSFPVSDQPKLDGF